MNAGEEGVEDREEIEQDLLELASHTFPCFCNC